MLARHHGCCDVAGSCRHAARAVVVNARTASRQWRAWIGRSCWSSGTGGGPPGHEHKGKTRQTHHDQRERYRAPPVLPEGTEPMGALAAGPEHAEQQENGADNQADPTHSARLSRCPPPSPGAPRPGCACHQPAAAAAVSSSAFHRPRCSPVQRQASNELRARVTICCPLRLISLRMEGQGAAASLPRLISWEMEMPVPGRVPPRPVMACLRSGNGSAPGRRPLLRPGWRVPEADSAGSGRNDDDLGKERW